MCAFKFCEESLFPSISKFLHAFLTLPCSSASSERSFSAMKLLKNYLRNTMKTERMSSLALMFVEKDVEISIDDVIFEFSKENRKLDFGEPTTETKTSTTDIEVEIPFNIEL